MMATSKNEQQSALEFMSQIIGAVIKSQLDVEGKAGSNKKTQQDINQANQAQQVAGRNIPVRVGQGGWNPPNARFDVMTGRPIPGSGMVPVSGSVGTNSVDTRFENMDFIRQKAQEQASIDTDKKLETDRLTSADKIKSALKRMAVLNNQWNDALPSAGRAEWQQRIFGPIEEWKVAKGLTSNPKLYALKKNIRPLAISLIRSFGEVGNLSESEQKGAIDVINQADATDEERRQIVKQFAEYALQGVDESVLDRVKNEPAIRDIIDAFGIRLDASAFLKEDELNEDDLDKMSASELQSLKKRLERKVKK